MKLLLAAVLLALVISPAYAQISSVDVKFYINQDDSVEQSNRFTFDAPINGTLSYDLDGSVRDIKVFDMSEQVDSSLVHNSSGYVINITLKNPTTVLTINYIADNVIFHSNGVNLFFPDFTFDNQIKSLSTSIKLPIGYILDGNNYNPSDAEIKSDGKSIILSWNEDNVSSASFSVKYGKPDQESSIWIAIISILLATLLFVYFYHKQRKKEDFMFGFRHDEKIVIQYLQEKRIILQRDLEEQFKFSRAKATRIVSRLVEKGLVKKQRYGRTNKITWLK